MGGVCQAQGAPLPQCRPPVLCARSPSALPPPRRSPPTALLLPAATCAPMQGIKNKKRSRMVYDEVHGEFRPRYGYKRVDKDGSQLPWVEVPANAGASPSRKRIG